MPKFYIFIAVLVVIVGGFFLFAQDTDNGGSITNFEECVEAGFPVMESYPRQCRVGDGDTFTEELSDEDKVNLIPNNMSKIIFNTNLGDITIELFSDLAPATVENFLKLARGGFYDGTRFHRVIAGFMIQGGDPLTKDESQKALWGTGGPGYQFSDEIHGENYNVSGTISMANSGPNTNGSQFFINIADNNFLDAKHTVFGKVTVGMDVVRRIEDVQTEGPDRPVDGVVIERVSF